MNRGPLRLAALVALVIVTAVVYAKATTFGYVEFDDPQYVRDNPIVLSGPTFQGIAWAFTTDTLANWHPLTWISYMIDVEIYRAWLDLPRGIHLTNILIHIANVLLLGHVLHALTARFWPSLLVAALFALHPMHVESVAWISERKDVLSTLFWLLAIWAYVAYTRQGRVGRYALVALFFALGLMTKPMVVTLPCVLLLLDYWPLKRLWVRGKDDVAGVASDAAPLARLVLEKLPLLGVAIGAGIATLLAQRVSHALEDGQPITLGLRVENALVSYVQYLAKLLWPMDLSALYPHPSLIGGRWPVWQVLVSAAILVGITLGAGLLLRRHRFFVVGWLWFLGTMLPVIGLIQVGRASMADRYAYIPFIGLYIIIAWTIDEIASRRPALRTPVATTAIIGLGALAMLTHRQVGVWRDNITLFSHAVQATRDNWTMHNNLAAMLHQAGRSQEAVEELNKAIAIFPTSASLHAHRGEIQASTPAGLYESQLSFEKSVELDPSRPRVWNNLGIVRLKRQDTDGAIQAFERALSIDSAYKDAQNNLALARQVQGSSPR